MVMKFPSYKNQLALTSSSFDNNDREKLLSPSATFGLDSGEFDDVYCDHCYNFMDQFLWRFNKETLELKHTQLFISTFHLLKVSRKVLRCHQFQKYSSSAFTFDAFVRLSESWIC